MLIELAARFNLARVDAKASPLQTTGCKCRIRASGERSLLVARIWS